jgi:tyrosine-specific transport protein
MKKLINSIFLVSGTAIGAGLISLPLAAANIGLFWSFIIILVSLFVAYVSSCMSINLSVIAKRGLSIVELSRSFSGNIAGSISMLSFYILSFALLTVYFSAVVSIISYFTGIHMNSLFAILCGGCFYLLFSLKINAFNKTNSFLFLLLLLSVSVILCWLHTAQKLPIETSCLKMKDLFYVLPIIFTSFGVQNVCHFVCNYLEMDEKKIKKSFFYGILIAAVVYATWIYIILNTVYCVDTAFFQKILEHKVESGELVTFLCNFSASKYMALFFEGLTLFAIVTSAIGIGVGLVGSLKEISPLPVKKYTALAVIGIPVLATIFIPNVFMRVLSFGGIIATVFVIFMPFYLLCHLDKRNIFNLKYLFCFLFGLAVVAAGLV